MKSVKRNGLYVLVGSVPKICLNVSVSNDKTKLWCMRLAHISENGLRELSKQGLFGSDQISSLELCEKCVFGKATRQRFFFGKYKTKQSLDYAYLDLWGLSRVPSHSGTKYFVTS